MKILLDTHTFIWWDSETDKLSQVGLDLCQDVTNTLLLSVASVWEMQVKLQLSKLSLKLPLAELINTQVRTNNVEILPIRLNHIFALESLPSHHKDPFDRLIIAQANIEGALLLSCDPIFTEYPVNVR